MIKFETVKVQGIRGSVHRAAVPEGTIYLITTGSGTCAVGMPPALLGELLTEANRHRLDEAAERAAYEAAAAKILDERVDLPPGTKVSTASTPTLGDLAAAKALRKGDLPHHGHDEVDGTVEAAAQLAPDEPPIVTKSKAKRAKAKRKIRKASGK